MLEKKTYKIKFSLNVISFRGFDYTELDPDYLYNKIYFFCRKNKIKFKKIRIHSCLSYLSSYVKVDGTIEDQIKLYNFLQLNFSEYITLRHILKKSC